MDSLSIEVSIEVKRKEWKILWILYLFLPIFQIPIGISVTDYINEVSMYLELEMLHMKASLTS